MCASKILGIGTCRRFVDAPSCALNADLLKIREALHNLMAPSVSEKFRPEKSVTLSLLRKISLSSTPAMRSNSLSPSPYETKAPILGQFSPQTVILSTFGQFLIIAMVPSRYGPANVISRMLGNRAHFRSSSCLMERTLVSVAFRISNTFKLDMRAKESTNILAESSGPSSKFSSAESVLRRWYLVNVVREPKNALLDVGTDGGVTHDVCGLRVQPTHRWEVVKVSVVEVASLHIFPEKWKECVAQAPASHSQFAERGQPSHVLYGGLLAPLSTG